MRLRALPRVLPSKEMLADFRSQPCRLFALDHLNHHAIALRRAHLALCGPVAPRTCVREESISMQVAVYVAVPIGCRGC